MNTIPRFALLLLSPAALLLPTSCGTYENIPSASGSQTVPKCENYQRVSGRPNLHVPARVGILASGRLEHDTLTEAEIHKLQQPGIREILPVNSYVKSSECYCMNDMMARRAMIIDNTRLLGLDLILLCDEEVQENTHRPIEPISWLTLGAVNPQATRTHAQLNVAMMDARTGYVYGVIGNEGKGSSASLTFLEEDPLKQAGKHHASRSAKEQLVDRFPAFWARVKGKYLRR